MRGRHPAHILSQTGGIHIYSKKEARPLEEAIQRLFGETSYQVVRTPCRGKYHGHSDYSLVFGSGRKLYVGLDQRNYVPKLREHLGCIQYFREHQTENTERIKAALAAHDTPFCDAAVDISPYPGSNDLVIYGVVVLTHQSGIKLMYRETNMHYFLVSGDRGWHSFDACMAHLLKDACGEQAYCMVYDAGGLHPTRQKHPARRREEAVR